jgi:hypothetical protein
MQMREMISPFKNRPETEEEGVWVINPNRIKRNLMMEREEDTKDQKQHLGTYIFNDSPENTYEEDQSPYGSILGTETYDHEDSTS